MTTKTHSSSTATLRRASRRVLALALLCASLFANAWAQTQKVVSHEVKKGETLYKLSHDYGVSIDDIIERNPILKSAPLKAGQTLSIALPLSVSSTSVGETALPAPSGAATTAAQQRSMPISYKVKKDETLWGISRNFGITVDALIAANPEMQEPGYKLKKGRTITIPANKPAPAAPAAKGLASVRLSVIMPLQTGGVEAKRSTEYVRGLLLAMKQLKQQGRNIVLHVYEEPASGESLRGVMQRVNAQGTDLIIGPVYPNHWTEAIALSQSDTKIVIPFSSKVQQIATCPRLYMLNAPQQNEAAMITDLVASSFHKDNTHFIFLKHSVGDGAADKQSVASALTWRAVADGYKHIALPSSAELTVVKNAIKKGMFNLLVTDASDAETQQRMQSMVTALRQTLPSGTTLALLGYETWLDRASTDSSLRNVLYSSDTYVAATAFYYPYTSAAMAFEADYKKWFGADLLAVTPRMAPLGYDTALAFVNGLATYGKSYAAQRQPLSFLQSDLRFSKVSEQGGYVSQSAWLIHYKPNMQIDKIAKTR